MGLKIGGLWLSLFRATQIINDVRHLRRRAQEAGALAEHLRGADAQATMLKSPLNTNGLPIASVSAQSRQDRTREERFYQPFIRALSSISK
jgi:hypothetical protein